jgi:hypothetical protein
MRLGPGGGLRRTSKGLFVGASLAWLLDCVNRQVFNLARGGAPELQDANRTTEYAPYTTSIRPVGWAFGGSISDVRDGWCSEITWS